MSTPAELAGLSGLGLDSRLRKVFYAISAPDMLELVDSIDKAIQEQKLVYWHENRAEPVRVFPRPLAVMPDQLGYLHFASLTILNALKRLPELYLSDPDARRVLALSAAEEAWVKDSWGPSQRETNPVFGRLDATIEFTSPMWKDSLQFLEPNLSGVGGLHMAPACERILANVVLPLFRRYDPYLSMEAGADIRELLVQELLDHAAAIGRKGQHICFIEPKYVEEGPEEQARIAEYYREKHGLEILHADPAELSIENGEVTYQGRVVDIGYRDYEIRDLLALEKEGVDLAPIRKLFRENRIVSSAAGDFDHKSCWELLTDPDLSARHFNAEERAIFRRHILWTRIVSHRSTMLPDGQAGDLVEFARREREMLVLKPNRSYGGDRVILGHLVDQATWESEIELALAGPDEWVVQKLASIPVVDFPIATSPGIVEIEPFYTVMGLAPTKYGMAIMGRASQRQVVNIAQRGGMCAILVGRPLNRE